MIRIAITQAAFEAISATLPLGSVGYEGPSVNGEYLIWLAPNVVNRLRDMRGPGRAPSKEHFGERVCLKPTTKPRGKNAPLAGRILGTTKSIFSRPSPTAFNLSPTTISFRSKRPRTSEAFAAGTSAL